jgi:hypothetical protein
MDQPHITITNTVIETCQPVRIARRLRAGADHSV